MRVYAQDHLVGLFYLWAGIICLPYYRYGSLAATGKVHMAPQALMMGFEGISNRYLSGYRLTFIIGSDPETIDAGTVNSRYDSILASKTLMLNGSHRIDYDMDRDMIWRWDQVLPTHPNGMRFSVFN